MPAKPGRPPRYDWDDKRDICYKLFVEEKRSVNQIIKYFAEHFGVAESDLPCEKNFSRQFSVKWGFPKRKDVLEKDLEEQLGARMKEMWEKNMQMVDIREVFEREGHVLSNYDFHKLKTKFGVKRRADYIFGELSTEKGGKESNDVVDNTSETGTLTTEQENALTLRKTISVPELSAEDAALTAQRLADRRAVGNQSLRARKRRRAERDSQQFGGGEPQVDNRYVCEITIDECKARLGLNNDLYLAIRKQYDAICVEMDIERKKGALEDGRWQQSKDRLIRENMHLSAVMHPLQPNLAQKELGLDLICADVAKRLRDGKKQITIAGANNILGLNPADSKALRRAFYQILEDDKHTTRLDCGKEHFQELKEKWYNGSPFLQQILAGGDPLKIKCVGLLCRDASKRYNDNMVKHQPERQQFKKIYNGPGPGAAKHKTRPRRSMNQMNGKGAAVDVNADIVPFSTTAGMSHSEETRPISQPAIAPVSAFSAPMQVTHFNQHIDPVLASATVYAPVPPTVAFTNSMPSSSTPRGPIPAYFRLSPASQIIGNHARMWLGKLTSATVPALHAAALSKAGGARVRKVSGVVKSEDGTEDNYQIDGDDELNVYLEAAGEKPTFVVLLEGGYA